MNSPSDTRLDKISKRRTPTKLEVVAVSANHSVRIHNRKKKVFDKYLYSITLRVTDVRNLINTAERVIAGELSDKQARTIVDNRNNNYYRWDVAKANFNQIMHLAKAISNFKDRIRVSMQYNYVTVYSEDEETLLQFIRSSHEYIASSITEIYFPLDLQQALSLEKDCVIMNSDFAFKVTIKNKPYNKSTRDAIYSFTERTPDVKIIPSINYYLRPDTTSDSVYLRGYFYANKEADLMFLKMIDPDFVNKIYKIKKPE